jgi:hypothetical protein
MDWTARHIDTLFFQEPTGIVSGNLAFGTLTSVSARIEEYPIIVSFGNGEEKAGTHRVSLHTNLAMKSRCWIASADTSSVDKSYRILKKETAKTLDGSYRLYILTLGR